MATLFKQKYNDDKLSEVVEKALNDDPTVHINGLIVVSNNGIVRLRGSARDSLSKRHAAESARRSVERAKLSFQRIDDEILLKG